MTNTEPSDEEIRQVMASMQNFIGKSFGYGLALFLFLFAFALMGIYLVHEHVTQPGAHGEPVAFSVPEGASGNDVARLLAEADLVERAILFRLAIRLDDSKEAIKHGTHVLPKGASPMELLAMLRENPPPRIDPDAAKITVPEGLTIAQIAEAFEPPEAFLVAVETFDPTGLLHFEVPSLEGFLMPNTYYFAEEPLAEELITRMLEQFQTEYSKLLEEFPALAEEDPLRLVTIASLVEEEARVDEERPIIAAVIYNRLARDRALEMDSTLQYALGKYGQRLLNEDKQVDSPYNTYKRRGLPPGPISNPGVASLRAAMAPADVDYLYFVSNADGKTHTFSSNIGEHEQAVLKYRREIREQRRELEAEQGN